MKRIAVMSGCGRYRYELWRKWSSGLGVDAKTGFPLFIMLNPSTADGKTDDATIRRVVCFAKAWQYSQVCVVNLFGLRTTYPEILLVHEDPVGRYNKERVIARAKEADRIVCAWGVHGEYQAAGEVLLRRLKGEGVGDKLMCFGKTKDGHPLHPLYLSASAKLQKV